jgi:inner membrane protein
MANTELNLFERFNLWLKESITIKLVSIGFLLLILLLPSAWIQELMEERQERADSVILEISNKWSESQTLSGPVLVIPYKDTEKIRHGKDDVEIQEIVRKAFFLPETLNVTGEVKPEILHRGIFDAAVYESSLQLDATFPTPDFASLGVNPERVLWSEAYLAYSITDLRGISENPALTVDGKKYTAEPANHVGVAIRKFQREIVSYSAEQHEYEKFSTSGIVAKLNWKTAEDFKSNTALTLNLKGSNRLSFVPVGKTTEVKLSGPWQNPSYDGEFLPATREMSPQGFAATWKILHFNRPFSQQWKDGEQELAGSEFGMKLLIPVDQYQKSIRTSKYGILIILLTFVALFLVEIIRKIRIHPFQYILIGGALIIYYALLLSLSEHLGYNISYGIATLATVALIGAYSRSFLRENGLVLLFTSVLVVFYGFIFIIILQQDFSLLIGSVGLFIIMGLLMYFSRKVDWYKDNV